MQAVQDQIWRRGQVESLCEHHDGVSRHSTGGQSSQGWSRCRSTGLLVWSHIILATFVRIYSLYNF